MIAIVMGQQSIIQLMEILKKVINVALNSKFIIMQKNLYLKKIWKKWNKKEDIENNLDYQEAYFKYMVSIHPSIGYYDIAFLLHEKYETKKIIYKYSNLIHINNL